MMPGSNRIPAFRAEPRPDGIADRGTLTTRLPGQPVIAGGTIANDSRARHGQGKEWTSQHPQALSPKPFRRSQAAATFQKSKPDRHFGA
jgi:hypothetical protein